MNTGTVKFFNASKGFGFITTDEGKDIFFHISEVEGQEPQDGDKVEFEVGNVALIVSNDSYRWLAM